MTPAYAYLRVSGTDQVEGDGFERQELFIRKCAALHGYEITHVFREQITGTADSMDRPQWVAMIAQMQLSNVTTIIVEKLDRLARQMGIQEYILQDLSKRGITLIPADDPTLISDDPMRVAFRQIIGVFAQYDRTMIVLKLKGARERVKLRDGRCEGRKPYGHYDGEPAIVAEMLLLRAGGATYDRISTHLNERGLKPRKGRWHQATVGRILQRVERTGGRT